eukprot:13092829-Alexandrium_andersonii.AAC.1
MPVLARPPSAAACSCSRARRRRVTKAAAVLGRCSWYARAGQPATPEGAAALGSRCACLAAYDSP